MSFGETLEEALRREVQEETGLLVRVGEPVLLSDTIAPNGRRHIVNITFACTIEGGALGTPEDPRVEAVDLFAPEQLGSLDLRPPMAEAVADVLARGEARCARYLGSLYTPEPSSSGCHIREQGRNRGEREGGVPPGVGQAEPHSTNTKSRSRD